MIRALKGSKRNPLDRVGSVLQIWEDFLELAGRFGQQLPRGDSGDTERGGDLGWRQLVIEIEERGETLAFRQRVNGDTQQMCELFPLGTRIGRPNV